MLRQLPKLFFWQRREEREWLKKFIKHQPLNVVISDNRYGLYHPSTQNILITHQLGLRSGLTKGADRILRRVHDRLLKKFNACWVPDEAGHPNLSGELGHPTWEIPIPVQYIGPLTRFHFTENPVTAKKITIVLSGPEPQRTLLEKKCLKELCEWNGMSTLVRGLPDGSESIEAPPEWISYNHLPTDRLQQEIQEAEWVIARSGYSSLMDLFALKKKAILIPTPGQPEQEYLANWIAKQGMARCIRQEDDLSIALSYETAGILALDISNKETNRRSELIHSLDQLRSLRS